MKDVGSMRRMSLTRQVMLVGVAFSIGLFLGLCVHLPGVMSPEGQTLEEFRRSARISRDLKSSYSDLKQNDAPQRLGKMLSMDSPLLVPNPNLERNAGGLKAKKNRTSKDGGERLKAKMKAIKETYRTIQAVKANQDKTKFKDAKVQEQREERETEPEIYGTNTVSVLVSGQAPPRTIDGENIDSYVNNPPRVENVYFAKNTATKSEVSEKKPVYQTEFHNLDDIVKDGVYWSQTIETMLPKGFTDDDIKDWRKTLDTNKVVGMQEGCGRMQNRRLLLGDSKQACARYRINTDQIQGEVYSYYLARLLGIRNLPPTILGVASPGTDAKWAGVDEQVIAAQWGATKPVVLTPWLEKLKPVYIPRELRQPGAKDDTGNIRSGQNLHPSPSILTNRTLPDLLQLVQWSDLIIFDFLNANVDRLVNNMFNLQWNTEIMNGPTHNLESRSADNLLLFIDNESGLFHSYRLLDKYSHFHETLLASLCIFREETATNLKRLHKSGKIGDDLMKLYRKEEPLHWMLPELPEGNVKTLQNRIEKVVNQIRRCESKYRNNQGRI